MIEPSGGQGYELNQARGYGLRILYLLNELGVDITGGTPLDEGKFLGRKKMAGVQKGKGGKKRTSEGAQPSAPKPKTKKAATSSKTRAVIAEPETMEPTANEPSIQEGEAGQQTGTLLYKTHRFLR